VGRIAKKSLKGVGLGHYTRAKHLSTRIKTPGEGVFEITQGASDYRGAGGNPPCRCGLWRGGEGLVEAKAPQGRKLLLLRHRLTGYNHEGNRTLRILGKRKSTWNKKCTVRKRVRADQPARSLTGKDRRLNREHKAKAGLLKYEGLFHEKTTEWNNTRRFGLTEHHRKLGGGSLPFGRTQTAKLGAAWFRRSGPK